MPDSTPPRLASLHLEDLAIIALTAGSRQPTLYPELEDDRRARLRARIKQIARYNWPSSMKEDPHLKRGHTLRQCCRLIVALLLIDAHLPPSFAIPLAAENEITFLRAMAARLRRPTTDQHQEPADPLALVILGELWALVDEAGWCRAEPPRVRLIERSQLHRLWDADLDLASPGQRLIVDIGAAAQAMWRWMSDRQLMPAGALGSLLAEVDQTGSSGV